jgi:hypothetical protein
MRWLLIALLVSLGALLLAAAGLARHILVQRTNLSRKPIVNAERKPMAANTAFDPAEDADIEP